MSSSATESTTSAAVYCCTTKVCPANNSLLLLQEHQSHPPENNYFSVATKEFITDDTAVCSTSAPPTAAPVANFEHMELLPRGNLHNDNGSGGGSVAVVRPTNINSNFKQSTNPNKSNKATVTTSNSLKIPSTSPSKKKFHSNSSSGNVLHINKNCNNGTNKNARLSSRSMQLGNLVRTKLYSSFPNLHNQVVKKEAGLNCKWYNDDDENIRKVLKAVASDHVVSTPTEDNKIRRTVYIERVGDEKFGFIIQSYAFQRGTNGNQMEQITYVDYVALDGPAFRAGLRAGDVILAINGMNIQSYGHNQLVRYIGDCKTLRMVVLFENCVNRVELCTRAIKLKKLLSDKEFELKTLLLQEDRLLKGLPVLSQDEILTLLRTPSNSPSLDRVTVSRLSSYTNRRSVPSEEDAFSTISIASTSYENPEEEIDDSTNPNIVSSRKPIVKQRYSDSGVRFVVGCGSETNSSNRASDNESLSHCAIVMADDRSRDEHATAAESSRDEHLIAVPCRMAVDSGASDDNERFGRENIHETAAQRNFDNENEAVRVECDMTRL